MNSNNKNLIVAFIDRVAPKNRLQIDVIHHLGYCAMFFSNQYIKHAETYFSKNDIYEQLLPSFFLRLKQVFTLFKKHASNIHHAEIYPGGRYSFIYLILAKFFKISVICVERGDLLYYKKGGYDFFTRFSMWVCYRFSTIVWYREPYMKPILDTIGVKKSLFIHNAVAEIDNQSIKKFQEKDIHFLWLNRLIPERESGWFIDILNKSIFNETNNILAGLLNNTLYSKDQEYVIKNAPTNLQLLYFVDNPSFLFNRAKFFVLPAKIVFANNSLLEAMSFGVVPIITKGSGYELIVEEGVNGIIANNNRESFEYAMKRAMEMKCEEYEQMSFAATMFIKENFSTKKYLNDLNNLYNQIK